MTIFSTSNTGRGHSVPKLCNWEHWGRLEASLTWERKKRLIAEFLKHFRGLREKLYKILGSIVCYRRCLMSGNSLEVL